MKHITIDIDCTDEHCGKCFYVCRTNFGQVFHCALFIDKNNYKFVQLDLDDNLRLLRCEECKNKIK